MTLASLLTPEGMVLAAPLVTAFVALLNRAWPMLRGTVSGARAAFVVSALLYVWAAFTLTSVTAESLFSVFIAWLGCATSAVGVHGAFTQLVKSSKAGA